MIASTTAFSLLGSGGLAACQTCSEPDEVAPIVELLGDSLELVFRLDQWNVVTLLEKCEDRPAPTPFASRTRRIRITRVPTARARCSATCA
jgi:hypothetical protein